MSYSQRNDKNTENNNDLSNSLQDLQSKQKSNNIHYVK